MEPWMSEHLSSDKACKASSTNLSVSCGDVSSLSLAWRAGHGEVETSTAAVSSRKLRYCTGLEIRWLCMQSSAYYAFYPAVRAPGVRNEGIRRSATIGLDPSGTTDSSADALWLARLSGPHQLLQLGHFSKLAVAKFRRKLASRQDGVGPSVCNVPHYLSAMAHAPADLWGGISSKVDDCRECDRACGSTSKPTNGPIRLS